MMGGLGSKGRGRVWHAKWIHRGHLARRERMQPERDTHTERQRERGTERQR